MSNLEPLIKLGDWYYRPVQGILWPAVDVPAEQQKPLQLELRLHSLLNYFLLHPQKLLHKDTLIDQVWPDAEGTDGAVMRAVGALRKALGDDSRSPRYIATVSKKGYCWLQAIEPLTSSQINAQTTQPLLTEPVNATDNAGGISWRGVWRFALLSTFGLLVVGGSLAYLLASFTAGPLTRLPDQIQPISALSGLEDWPIFHAGQQQLFYQHRAAPAAPIRWLRQDLASLRIFSSEQSYQKMGVGSWLDEQHLLFRALTMQGQCGMYRQQVIPDFAPPELMQPCQHWLDTASVLWQVDGQQQWYWLDWDDERQQYQLWTQDQQGQAQWVQSLRGPWRQLSQLVVHQQQLYLLAQTGFNQSALFQLSEPGAELTLLQHFPYQLYQLSVFDQQHLLLNNAAGQLALWQGPDKAMQALGPMSENLLQASRYQQRVLGSQLLDYTTDIQRWQPAVAMNAEGAFQTTELWQASNRSERHYSGSADSQAFVSERNGSAQIWLLQQEQNRLLTNLQPQQQVQQLLWHQQQLLALINSQLYQVSLTSTELTLLSSTEQIIGRVESCSDELWLSSYTSSGWQLRQLSRPDADIIKQSVVDMRCAGKQLLLQFSDTPQLASWQPDSSEVSWLPYELDWRDREPQQWGVYTQGLFWLAPQQAELMLAPWHSEQLLRQPLTARVPLQLYFDSYRQQWYQVTSRPYDTDIVWLQNRS
ncbi:winged helix-turn-helix domain-containing protein [Arsukibacterium sp.]|uniref:winged helix-turn-helix domain-containing protein n=1 Tax=Arsukibacterium sp. TaxID=1977258 RepID=UPI002FDB61B2